MKSKFQLLFIAIIMTLPLTLNAKTQWHSLLPGLEYTHLAPQKDNPLARLHAFRLNLKKFKFNLTLAHDVQQPTITAHEIATQFNALLAINGGFFTPTLKSIGLRIHDGKIKSPLKKFSWSGIFYITKSRQPKIVSVRNFSLDSDIDFAIQTGPLLIIDDKIPRLKPDLAERTAIGITRDNQIIVAITQNAPMTTKHLAEILQEFNCNNALNLDGGWSTQLYAQIKKVVIAVEGYSRVVDVVWVSENRT